MPTDISKIISEAAYQAYERRLLAQVRSGVVPHHVAIIMDGNRRFAVELGLGNPAQGHERGRDKLEEVLQWCLDIGVRILTVYAFSTENLTRPTEEIRELMRLFAENFRKVRDDKRLYAADLPDPDLVLRTSGEERISNFLLWQLAYSELYFVDVYWPGFRKIDFLRAIRSFQQRQRRYGA